MKAEQEYRIQVELDNELDRLMERLRGFEDAVGSGECARIVSRLYKTAGEMIKHYGFSNDERERGLDLKLRELFPTLPTGELFSSPTLKRKLNSLFESTMITKYLNENHVKLGVARIQVGFRKSGRPLNWLKIPDDCKDIELPKSHPGLGESSLESWNFLTSALENHGYCESPNMFSDLYLSNFREKNLPWCDSTKLEREGYTYINFPKWLEEGQPVFDDFLERSKLPVAMLDGKIALMYHPAKLREIQGIGE